LIKVFMERFMAFAVTPNNSGGTKRSPSSMCQRAWRMSWLLGSDWRTAAGAHHNRNTCLSRQLITFSAWSARDAARSDCRTCFMLYIQTTPRTIYTRAEALFPQSRNLETKTRDESVLERYV
jgi:hypothetical protein